MKTKIFAIFFGAILFASCQQKEMKISRSDFSVVSEITDISPAYIIVNEKGNTELKKNSLIGNTHWVLSVDRDLSLKEIGPFLQELTQKKHKKGGMHEDSKDIYFVYSDTVHKQNAYVKLPFREVILEKPSENELNKRPYNFVIYSLDRVELEESGNLGVEEDYLASFDKKMSVEMFVNSLIELEKQKFWEKVNTRIYIY